MNQAMQKGIDYIKSDKKQILDAHTSKAVSWIAYLLSGMAERAVHGNNSLAGNYIRVTRDSPRGPISFLKLRTMRPPDEDESYHPMYDNQRQISGRTVKVVRKAGLDELRQVEAVVNGDMSMVGPRPMAPEDIETIARHARPILGDEVVAKWLEYMESAKPGICGASQTFRHGNEGRLSWEDLAVGTVIRDIDYFENANRLTDIGHIVVDPLLTSYYGIRTAISRHN